MSLRFPDLNQIGLQVVELGIRHPRAVLSIAALLTIVLGLLIIRIDTDTDPENMLPANDEVRLRNAELEARFALVNG